jgi:tRNA pseudouridine13 synthase
MISFDQQFPTLNKINASGVIRSKPKDFVVTEKNDLEFTESGEHLWMRVEKTSSNTAWVATQIASACKVPARQVGFAGQKDRHAVTQQWFSVQLPKIRDVNIISEKLTDEVKIIESHWHQSKIKKGQLKGNEFQIIIRDVKGDIDSINNNIESIKAQGVPNYFGPQRFGNGMGNLQKAEDWFDHKIKVNNKNLRSLLISTARSHLFNLILAERLRQHVWNKTIEGDILQLDGSHSWFPATDASEDELSTRLDSFDIHITAALWGENTVQSSSACANLETAIALEYPIYQKGFEKYRVNQDRRSMRVIPGEFSHQWQNNQLALKFTLPPGAFATGVIREILEYSQPG